MFAPLILGSNPMIFPVLKTGDVDGDNRIILTDFSLFASSYGLASTHPNYKPGADFNNDNQINLIDFSLLASSYGQQGANP
jgi:hypothetical protein